MIKKTLLGLGISLLSFIGFSNGVLLSGHLGNNIDSSLNFNPNPLFINSDINNSFVVYGWIDDSIYLGVGLNGNSVYNYHYLKILFNNHNGNNGDFTDSFYNSVSNGSFVPVSYSISWNGYLNGGSVLTLYDNSGEYYQSSCYYNSTSSSVPGFCGNKSVPTFKIDSINDFPVNNSPFGSSGGGNVSNSFVDSSAIEYLEKVYDFNSSLCYVGIDDLSVNYGGAGSFTVGGGKTIFELFDYMNGSSESVSNVGIWINSWIINYQQWFDNFGKTAEPTYLTNYSNGQVSVYYDNLTFPFLNKPAGLYFMSNNLYDSSVASNGNMGQELAIYCDLKLNGENASPIPEDSDLYKNVINYEYFNKNNGNSYYNGSGNLIIYQKPGEDSIFYDDYFGDFSGDYTDYFKGYEEIFNNFTSKFNIREYRTVGIIPGYILFFFALVVLFKLIRK